MTDLEMTKLCAEAMGYGWNVVAETVYCTHDGLDKFIYRPLHDDAQAMALVKKFDIDITKLDDFWDVNLWPEDGSTLIHSLDADLNRAIVECVAKMQASK